jgi:hypothetical protein
MFLLKRSQVFLLEDLGTRPEPCLTYPTLTDHISFG